MKTKFILFLFLFVLFQSCNNDKKQQVTEQATSQEKQQTIDTTGAKPYPVMIKYVAKEDSIPGFAMAKAVVNEKTLQAEMQVIQYLDANMKPLEKGTKITNVIKR